VDSVQTKQPLSSGSSQDEAASRGGSPFASPIFLVVGGVVLVVGVLWFAFKSEKSNSAAEAPSAHPKPSIKEVSAQPPSEVGPPYPMGAEGFAHGETKARQPTSPQRPIGAFGKLMPNPSEPPGGHGWVMVELTSAECWVDGRRLPPKEQVLLGVGVRAFEFRDGDRVRIRYGWVRPDAMLVISEIDEEHK
ncbi:MAG: hypothetical protein NZM37_12655, partial [Sandaracinaceae bacterium]|nr:hypothetical protein [Sandaracinaceae bacterium]